MSVIACTVDDSSITLVSDSAITYNECQQLFDPDSKLFVQGDFVIAGTGDIEVVHLWKAYISDPKQYVNRNPDWMHDFEQPEVAMMSLAQSYGAYLSDYGLQHHDGQHGYSAQFFIVTLPHVWEVSAHYVREIKDHGAIGIAEPAVRVALDLGASPELAVATACKYNTLCSMPLKKIVIDKDSGRVDTTYIYEMSEICSEAEPRGGISQTVWSIEGGTLLPTRGATV